ncbi:hypothetical protein ACFXPN_43085 [Streptomyces griseorubiginosus]|uniref:hypothetical protein n=1 Tax=Streptomyces griseorubiginosus TaxID=67304 RepID=UPI0036A07A30
MTGHWIGLVLFSLVLFLFGLALANGQVPHQLRRQGPPAQPLGWALLALYAVAPFNAIPRLAEAPPVVILVATAVVGAAAAAGGRHADLDPRRIRSATS